MVGGGARLRVCGMLRIFLEQLVAAAVKGLCANCMKFYTLNVWCNGRNGLDLQASSGTLRRHRLPASLGSRCGSGLGYLSVAPFFYVRFASFMDHLLRLHDRLGSPVA